MVAPYHSCPFCTEPILPTDEAMPCNGNLRGSHRECAFRAVAGSVGHQSGRCLCNGVEDTSEAGMTYRQAARAALDYWRRWHLAEELFYGEKDIVKAMRRR